jgi:hypothetical protein
MSEIDVRSFVFLRLKQKYRHKLEEQICDAMLLITTELKIQQRLWANGTIPDKPKKKG